MQRVSLLLVLGLSVVLSAGAQSPRNTGFLVSTTCPGTGCVSLSVSGVSSVAIQITGTWTGTVLFEGTVDGATYTALGVKPSDATTDVSSTTTNGLWSGVAGGLQIVRARMSVFGSGVAVVSIQGARGRQPLVGNFVAGGQIEFTDTPVETIPAGANGVLVTPNATAGANSNWFELSPNIGVNDIALASIVVQGGAEIVGYCVMLGVGAAAAEVQVAETCGFAVALTNGTREHVLTFQPPQVIGAGQRLAVRMRKGGTSVTQWGFAITYYDMPMVGNPVSTTAQNTIRNPTTSVTPNATAWANSAWAESINSTPQNWVIHHISVLFGNCVNRFYQIDLGTGGAGAEVVKWTGQSLVFGQTGCLQAGSPVTLPVVPALFVPSGSRIAFRLRKSDTDTLLWTMIPTYYPTSAGLSKIYTQRTQQWALTPSTTCATINNNTSTLWNPGAWVELIPSTANATALTALFEYTNGALGGERIYEYGVGTAGNEVVVGQTRALTGTFSGDWHSSAIYPAITVPSGSRVAMRMRADTITATSSCVNVGFIENPDFTQAFSKKTSGTWPDNASGVQPAPGGTAWTNGSWVTLVANSGAGRKLVTNLVVQIGGGNPREWEVDIGSGGAGAEQVVTTFRGFTNNTSAGIGSLLDRFAVPQRMPGNARLAVRVRGSGTNTTPWFVAVRWVEQ